jgi:NitT/TauT family transport system substrate-binding protein
MDHSSLMGQNAAASASRVVSAISGRDRSVRLLRRRPMKTTRAFRGLLALMMGFVVCLAGGRARAEDLRPDTKPPLNVQLSFDRPLESSMAPFIAAESRGLFAADGLSVRNDFVDGSPEAIARVASGASEFALVDLNELIRFRTKADAPPVKAVFVLFNQSPYAFVARKNRGIHALSDIEGKTIGVAESDLSIRLWPALAKQNGLKTSGVRMYRMSAAVREPILSAGQVDAVAGFSYLSAVNLRDRGVPASDLAVLRYNDYGCEAYGFAVIVNPAFAAAKPDAVKAFVRAAIAGTNFAVRNPQAAVDDVVGRMDGGSRELELERLNTVISDNILTGEVRHNGLGGIDPARLERSIGQVGEDFKFQKRPTAADLFDGSFLPPVGGRLIN